MRKDFNLDEDIEMHEEKYSMLHAHGEGVFEVPVGPIHAGIIEPGHFRFSQAGENIINLDAKLFYTHRGIEKAVENLSIDSAFYKIERICGACTVSHAFSFSQAIENLAHIEIPVRAKYIRMIVAELERLYNHVGDVGNLCAGVGFAVGISNGSRMKEYLMRLNEYIAGNRFLRGIIIPGGVNLDIGENDIKEIGYELDILESDFKEVVALLLESEAFLDRINHTGILHRKDALNLGVVGVAARASGVDLDTRRDHPYALYNTLDFKVPVYHSGDVAARLRVRVDEVFQSISIIRQIIEVISFDGPLKVEIPDISPYTSNFGWCESPRGSNVHWVMIGEKNKIYRCFVRSASYPNWPALTIAVPGNISPDFPLINKSFELCYACLDR
jgi:Ni,Fe-hydrogenase III large subunit